MFDCNPVAIAAGFLNACNSDSFLLIMLLSEKINSKIVYPGHCRFYHAIRVHFSSISFVTMRRLKDKYLFSKRFPEAFEETFKQTFIKFANYALSLKDYR